MCALTAASKGNYVFTTIDSDGFYCYVNSLGLCNWSGRLIELVVTDSNPSQIP